MTTEERTKAIQLFEKLKISDDELLLLCKLGLERLDLSEDDVFIDVQANQSINNKDRIYNVLNELKINSGLIGYQYLFKAIDFGYSKPSSMNKVTTVLYPNVARFFNVTTHSVEVSISRAVNDAFNREFSEKFKYLFGSTEFPSNKKFISTVVFYLRSQDGLACFLPLLDL